MYRPLCRRVGIASTCTNPPHGVPIPTRSAQDGGIRVCPPLCRGAEAWGRNYTHLHHLRTGRAYPHMARLRPRGFGSVSAALWGGRDCTHLHQRPTGRAYPHVRPRMGGLGCVRRCVAGKDCTHLHHPPTRRSHPHTARLGPRGLRCVPRDVCALGRGGGASSTYNFQPQGVPIPTGSAQD